MLTNISLSSLTVHLEQQLVIPFSQTCTQSSSSHFLLLSSPPPSLFPPRRSNSTKPFVLRAFYHSGTFVNRDLSSSLGHTRRDGRLVQRLLRRVRGRSLRIQSRLTSRGVRNSKRRGRRVRGLRGGRMIEWTAWEGLVDGSVMG